MITLDLPLIRGSSTLAGTLMSWRQRDRTIRIPKKFDVHLSLPANEKAFMETPAHIGFGTNLSALLISKCFFFFFFSRFPIWTFFGMLWNEQPQKQSCAGFLQHKLHFPAQTLLPNLFFPERPLHANKATNSFLETFTFLSLC